MAKLIGIDLGSSNTRIYLKNEGVILREPSLVSVCCGSGEVIAAGLDAHLTIGRLPGSADIVSPIKKGVIADIEKCSDMIADFLEKSALGKPNAIIALPSDISEDDKDDYIDALLDAGIKKAAVITRELAAEKFAESEGFSDGVFCDIGGAVTEIYLIEGGKVKVRRTVETAGNAFSEAIAAAAEKSHNMVISSYAADNLKYEIGSAFADADKGEAEIRGAHLVTGLPGTARMNSAEIREAISPELAKIAAGIKSVLAEKSEGTADGEILLAGGSAFLHGIDSLLTAATGVPARFAGNILDGITVGIGVIVENEKEYRDILEYES